MRTATTTDACRHDVPREECDTCTGMSGAQADAYIALQLIERSPELCGQCGVAVFWATTRKGKKILLDHAPVQVGKRFKVSVAGRGCTMRLMADYMRTDLGDGHPCHFDTCTRGDAE